MADGTGLRVVELSVEALGPIRSLALPSQGLGWTGFPDLVVVGGGNGSGKSTLLRFVAQVVGDRLEGRGGTLGAGHRLALEFGYGAPAVFESEASGWQPGGTGWHVFGLHVARAPYRVLLVPSPRAVRFPEAQPRVLDLRHDADANVRFHTWSAPADWGDSAEARLYEARWRDLNAKEEGRPDAAVHFARYAEAFHTLVPGRRLVWIDGRLRVEVVGTEVHHALAALSAGEQQLFLLLADLLTWWSPGSLVLLDEPELHLHPALQLRFFDALAAMRAARGGQLWLATQSAELFAHAPPGSQVLLGAGSAS
jgi:predicted ATPase